MRNEVLDEIYSITHTYDVNSLRCLLFAITILQMENLATPYTDFHWERIEFALLSHAAPEYYCLWLLFVFFFWLMLQRSQSEIE